MAEHSILDRNPTKSVLEACFFGFRQPYHSTLSLMHELHDQVVKKSLPNQLMLLEHEPVITITRQHLLKSLKTSEEAIAKSGIALEIADRGGDATFHGPGQLVGYPIIAIIDIAHYIRSLEKALLMAVQMLGVESAQLLPGFTGIWIKCIDKPRHVVKFKKLIAIGVGVKDGVSKHGFAMNIDIDHERYVEHIIPCGLKDRGVMTLRDHFYLRSLEMPSYSAIVKTISECLSHTFSLTLKWRP